MSRWLTLAQAVTAALFALLDAPPEEPDKDAWKEPRPWEDQPPDRGESSLGFAACSGGGED